MDLTRGDVKERDLSKHLARTHPFSAIQLLNRVVYGRLEYPVAAERLYDLPVSEERGEDTI